jgi:hypothetical protein
MRDLIGHKILVTTVAWFYGNDGIQYRAAWGTLQAVHEAKKVLGFSAGARNATYILEIGGMFINGCQVQYMIKCPDRPDAKTVPHQMYDHGHEPKVIRRMNEIYLTE